MAVDMFIKIEGIKGEASLGGTGGFDRASVRVEQAAATDTAPERRFNPILAKGQLALTGGVWGGTFQAATPTGAPRWRWLPASPPARLPVRCPGWRRRWRTPRAGRRRTS